MKLSLELVFTAILAATAAEAALDAKIKAKGKVYYGNIIDRNTINDGTIQNILNTEFGAITAENSWKWDSIEPSRGNFQFGNADSIANWATSRGKLIRGHTLVWHSQLPGWVNSVNDRNTLTQVITNHINQVAGRYRGRVYAWDVVNEVLEDNGNWRNSVFYRVLGEEFVHLAFRTARTADPDAKLYINDYNLDYAGPKIDNTLALVQRLRTAGTPIDGIGTQAHLVVGRIAAFDSQLQRLGATGLDVAITELDIRIPKPVDQAKLQQQQRDYNTVTASCVNLPQCVGITIWGVSDRYSWVDSTFPSDDAPLLWDDSNRRKIAYDGVDQALN
ncbi:glycosyl hydrolase family 10 protein [Coprinopsis marcescibilis]|uniref:Beta-xylanase n=1 Tax=Coprinopsis marcescibilis TaxID=230819 RepID=A0A5C3L021_COPMA|nr:glycosyl hydrolase family 10 protein [Coprinopsis marcescibilis]